MNHSEIESMATGKKIKVVQVAPGEFTADASLGEIPRYGLFHMVPDGAGNFRPVLYTVSRRVKLTARLPKQLGLDLTSHSLRVLCEAGFVEYSRPTPRTIQIDLESLAKHLAATEDPEYWTEKRLAQFSQARTYVTQRGESKGEDDE